MNYKYLGLFLLLATGLAAAKPLEFYLPEGEMFDATIPSPPAVLGQQLGDRHLRHDQIISYLSVLAASRPEARLIDYGLTNEGRRLVLLAISAADNIQNLDAVKSDPNILKLWAGFSVHGNESSGANASVLFAWYLLATNNPTIKNGLQDTVVLIDPVINPDGLSRFTTYVNNQRSLSTVSDPNDLSHVEVWPSGRTNHYWFDLNRDWLLLTQTESKSRIDQFHEWQPHVLTDHHEMGSAASFFFQPGVPSRKNPLITEQNVALTSQLAQFHADALDQAGQFYYSKESFDDFYPGKGSTYPDLQGSIGILFEQARAMGGVIDTHNGQRSLAVGIHNQFLTAVSTFKGAQQHKQALLAYKRNFFDQAKQQAAKLSTKGYVVEAPNGHHGTQKVHWFLNKHRIEHRFLSSNKDIEGHVYRQDSAIYIPLNQDQTTLVQSLFNTDTSFQDNTFYDVSAWHLGMAWGLHWSAVKSAPATHDDIPAFKPNNAYQNQAIAYAFDWHSGNAPAALRYLAEQHESVFISGKDMTINGRQLPAGSFVLPVPKDTNQDELFATLSTITDAFGVQWYPLTTSLAEAGIDLGSPNVRLLPSPKVMMLVGQGIDAYQAGSLWHLFDTQVYLPLTKVRLSHLPTVKLSDYTHIIMPDGNYAKHLSDEQAQALAAWVKQGGHLVALQRGAVWVEKHLQADSEETAKDKKTGEQSSEQSAEPKTPQRLSYADYDQQAAEKILGGAIVSAQADLSHPLAFGTHLATQHVLMKGSSLLQAIDPASEAYFHVPLQVTETVRAAGYVSDHWQEKLQNRPLVVAERSGQGTLIKFGFNPNFRAFWYGTQRWIINAIFHAELIKKTQQ
ncbi:M14 family metallopeptidase [Marinicella meishanensis]|uniref:M14 family metallopeptidase n=1 Tax=Marinicella meishanensis TaxID=2873263 RepID=UPI001CBABE2B|nr:M14 family metallopeptidase [Marinicella sp. NBU2979]